MHIEITRIVPLIPTKVLLQWALTPDVGVDGVYTFNVERSGSPSGPWEYCSGALEDVLTYEDLMQGDTAATHLKSLNREMYYRVRVTAPDLVQETSRVINLDGIIAPIFTDGLERIGTTADIEEQYPRSPDQDYEQRPSLAKRRLRLLRRKILRDEYVGFSKLYGIEAVVLKRKHFGVPCTTCRDTLTESLTKYKCATCFGTGWVGGFYTPVQTYLQARESTDRVSTTPHGPAVQDTTTISMLSFPEVGEGDIVVEKDSNYRWIVKATSPTEFRRLLVHQRVSVAALSRDSVEYDIKITDNY